MTNQPGLAKATTPGMAWVDRVKNVALDLLFPPHCAVCQRFGGWLCADCLGEIEAIEPPVCQYCGVPLDNGGRAAVCGSCQASPIQLDGIRSCAIHSGTLRKAIHQFKYEDLRALAGLLGQLMAEGWQVLAPPDLALDIIVPVPLHRTRERQRGYNQAALLARELGACLHLPVVEDTIVRSRATTPQVDLNAKERLANVRDAFECTDRDLAGKRVLLVDDVCTSGATLESACLALRGVGVTSVWACTLTRARPDPGALRLAED